MPTSSFNGKAFLAIGSCFLAAFSLSSMETAMKAIMEDGISPMFAQGVRGWLIFFGMIFLVAISKKPDFRIFRPGAAIMWARGVLMFAGSLLIFISLNKIEQATVTAMIFLYPLLVGSLGTFVFGEHLGPRRIIFIILGFIGVGLAAGFTPTTFEIWTVLPAIAAMLIAVQAIIVRWAPTDMNNTHLSYITVCSMAVCGLPFMLPSLPSALSAFSWDHVGLFAMVGVLGTSGTVCLAFAFKNAPMGLVGSLNYSSIIFSTILAWMFFAEVPSVRVFYAMGIIITAGLGYMYFQHRAEVAISNN